MTDRRRELSEEFFSELFAGGRPPAPPCAARGNSCFQRRAHIPVRDSRLAPDQKNWIPDTMKNMVAGAPYFSIVRESGSSSGS